MPAAISGVRDALMHRGMHAPAASCGEAQKLVVSVVRVRLDAVGIVASRSSVNGGGPIARATRVGVELSARKVGSQADAIVVTEHSVVASQASPLEQEAAIGMGVASASRRAGDMLVRRMTGEPGPSVSFP